jgi:hypothetical protein
MFGPIGGGCINSTIPNRTMDVFGPSTTGVTGPTGTGVGTFSQSHAPAPVPDSMLYPTTPANTEAAAGMMQYDAANMYGNSSDASRKHVLFFPGFCL